ncbi:MAG: YbjN domain-containing protein [Bacteroidota bacterium]|nr:YbjN domain-containing protein [Bacteroidota bacterium]
MNVDSPANYYSLVEEGITKIGVDAALCRSDEEGQWNLRTNTLELWVDLWYVEQENRVYFQVMTPMFSIPDEKTEQFYREILDINYQLINAAFVTYQGGIYLKQIMEANFLTSDEVALNLQRIGFYGEKFKEPFLGRYKVKKLEHHD